LFFPYSTIEPDFIAIKAYAQAVEEAKKRQVIVFTHNIAFVGK
jgi:hypothetical protein